MQGRGSPAAASGERTPGCMAVKTDPAESQGHRNCPSSEAPGPPSSLRMPEAPPQSPQPWDAPPTRSSTPLPSLIWEDSFSQPKMSNFRSQMWFQHTRKLHRPAAGPESVHHVTSSPCCATVGRGEKRTRNHAEVSRIRQEDQDPCGSANSSHALVLT